MHKYLFSLGGFAIALIFVGAGCSTTTPAQDHNTSMTSDTAMVEETTDTKTDDTMMETTKTEAMEKTTDSMETNDKMVPTKVINVTGKNFAFSQTEIKVKEGDIVQINFESTEGFHDWVVDEFDAATTQVNPGTKTSVTFVANKAGEYEYYCSVGQHRAAGMVGKLIVESADVAMMQKVGTYENYDASKLAMADTGDVVLFFHASWCPSCKALDSAILKEADTIPGTLTILKTDYDKQTELKKKYGVTSQHTLVQVDAQGNMIQKKLGGNKLSDISNWVK